MAASKLYTLDCYVEDLRKISRETEEESEIIRKVSPLAQVLASETNWLRPEHYEADLEQGFGVHVLNEEPDHSLAVFVVSWLPGRGTAPHDHGTWAVIAGVEGTEHNIRYQRLDDRSRPNYAEIEVKQEFDAKVGDVVCMRTAGIHSVHNNTDKMTLSLHTYGMHVNYTERSQFNLATHEAKDLIVKLE
jgi:predicted metal-dependent enzyme (double-stranded beta helix superfamily)